MPAIGPSDNQRGVLVSLGLKPADFENVSRDAISRSLQGRMDIPRRGNAQATRETRIKNRKQEIEKKGLKVGTKVDVLRADGVKAMQNRPIGEITDDGYVYLEGIKSRFLPKNIVPTSKGKEG